MVDRRSFVRIGGIAVLATIAGCTVPEVDDPDPEEPGVREEPSDRDAVPESDRLLPYGRGVERIELDYDDYRVPSDVYRVWTGNPDSYSFVDGAAYRGTRALRCTVPAGESSGSNAAFWFPENGYDQPTNVYQRVVFSLSDDWTMNHDDVCRFWCIGLNTESGPYGSGGRGAPSGTDGWSCMLAVANRQTRLPDEYALATYTYHMDQHGDSGEFELGDVRIRPNGWYELITQLRMNSVSDGEANHDGEVRIWLDGELVYVRTDFRWTTLEQQAVEYAGALVRYGGSETAPRDLHVYYDDHEIVLDRRSSRL